MTKIDKSVVKFIKETKFKIIHAVYFFKQITLLSCKKENHVMKLFLIFIHLNLHLNKLS